MKGVPIAVAEEEGSESEEDELKPRGTTTLQLFCTVTTINMQLQWLLLPIEVHIKLDVTHCFKGSFLKVESAFSISLNFTTFLIDFGLKSTIFSYFIDCRLDWNEKHWKLVLHERSSSGPFQLVMTLPAMTRNKQM